MKMKPEHFRVLKTVILDFINKESAVSGHPIQDHRESIKEEGKAKDIEKRLRWDLLRASKLVIGDGNEKSGLPLYAYLNDDHIDMALKAIIEELELKESYN